MTSIRAIISFLVSLLLAGMAVITGAGPAQAHGEQTQEAFLRASTAVLYDVSYSTTKLRVGEPLTVTGRLRIMDAWPAHTIAPPEIGFLSLVMPGPVFTIKDRQLNGTFTPQSVEIEKGATYDFSVTAIARKAGSWHVHPSFSAEGTGTLVGAGEWMEVGEGAFTNTIELASGETVDLSTYGMGRVAVWHLIAFALGLAWILLWVLRPVLARNAVVEAGGAASLISRRDLVLGGVFALVALGVIGGGYAYTALTEDTTPMPLQVARLHPQPLPAQEALVATSVEQAVWLEDEQVLQLSVLVDNQSSQPVSLTRMQVAEQTLSSSHGLTVDPATSVPAGESRVVTVRLDGELLQEHNLLPLNEPQVRITGLLFFTDSTGKQQVTEVNELTSPILPGRAG